MVLRPPASRLTWSIRFARAGPPPASNIGMVMLRDDPTPPARYAPDMLADPAMRAISAAVIRIFERLGWAAKVRWPTPANLDSRRRDSRRDGIR